MTLHTFMAHCRHRLDNSLQQLLPGRNGPAPRLTEAMRYAVNAGGKRIRPVLTYGACELAGGSLRQADTPAAAIELLHTYSLVHDDLPAMDDDDLRRGRATCHRAFDEATAILAGDTLHTLAFEVLANAGKYRPEQRLSMIRTLAEAAGAAGMAAGQMQDMLAEGKLQTLAALEQMHYLKTGRLITAAVELGFAAADNLNTDLQQALVIYGDAIGLAFQIQDDILDVTGNRLELGKAHGADAAHGKSTFPALIGLAASIQRAHELRDRACDAIAPFAASNNLIELAHYIVERRH